MLIRNKIQIAFIIKNNAVLTLLSFFLLFTALNGCEHNKEQPGITSQNTGIQKYFYKRLEGSIIGKGNIIMNLSGKDTSLSGNFYYEDKGEPVFFTFDSRRLPGDSVFIQERSGKFDQEFNEEQTGTFNGHFFNGWYLKGRWTDSRKGNTYIFSLDEKYPPGSYKFIMKSASKLYGDRRRGGAFIEYVFPQFADSTGSATDQINNSIKKNMISGYLAGENEKGFNGFTSEMTDFIARFKKFEKNPLFPKTYKPFWENSFYTYVVFNSNNIVVLEKVDFRYEGGAHPNTYYAFYNYSLKTAKTISLDDIFKSGFKAKLDETGEKLFKEKYNIKSGEDLEKAGYFLRNHKFHLNDNFAIFEKGLLFKFNPYEIAAYVFGAPDVFIPYRDLKDLLKKNSVISALIN